MATYNGEKFIASQIDSILSQLTLDDELVISDDGSTDRTLEIIKAYDDNRIRLYNNRGKSDLVQNFGNAIQKAKGDYIFLSDQDDVWFDNRIEASKELLDKYDLVVCNCHIVDQDLNVREGSYFNYLKAGPGLVKNLKKNTFLGCCMSFKGTLKFLILPFPTHIPMHDIWIGFVATLFGKVKFQNQVLLMYRRHENVVTNEKVGKSSNNVFGKIANRLNLLRYLPLLLKRKSTANIYGKL